MVEIHHSGKGNAAISKVHREVHGERNNLQMEKTSNSIERSGKVAVQCG